MKILTWPRPQSLTSSPEYLANSRLAREASSRGIEEIINRYTYVGPNEIKEVLEISPEIAVRIHGRGIDLGGGVGCVSAAVAQFPTVTEILCLEIVEECVLSCHSMVFSTLESPARDKITSVIGDFDNLQLDDQTMDFVTMWDTFHHSVEPISTLREIHRVLRPGGSLILVDRAHNNSITDEEINLWLAVEYDANFLRENFLDDFQGLTRLMNGEHEYRFFELLGFFQSAGFEISSALGVRFSDSEPLNDAGFVEVNHPVDLGGFIKKKFVFSLTRSL